MSRVADEHRAPLPPVKPAVSNALLLHRQNDLPRPDRSAFRAAARCWCPERPAVRSADRFCPKQHWQPVGHRELKIIWTSFEQNGAGHDPSTATGRRPCFCPAICATECPPIASFTSPDSIGSLRAANQAAFQAAFVSVLQLAQQLRLTRGGMVSVDGGGRKFRWNGRWSA